MTFVNAALLVIVALMIALILMLVRLRKLTEALLQRLTHIDNMLIDQKPRQRQVASKVGPTTAIVERPKVKQRHQSQPTGKISSAVRLVLKGGAERGDSERDRLQADPDQVHGTKRKTRWVGGPETGPRG